MSTMTHDEARAKLQARRTQLVAQVGKIESHLARPLEPDSQERSLQTENDEVLQRLDDAGRSEMASIDAALRRLDEGTYGACTRCHAAIPTARLIAMPHAELCIGCAAG